MKRAIFALLVVAASAQAARIEAGRYNAQKKAIDLEVSYGGGCGTHKFSLKVGGCLESLPVICSAELIEDNGGDGCEALIHETISLPLSENGLSDSYYKKASLRITGDRESTVSVTLP